jgi:hypothetical protein
MSALTSKVAVLFRHMLTVILQGSVPVSLLVCLVGVVYHLAKLMLTC